MKRISERNRRVLWLAACALLCASLQTGCAAPEDSVMDASVTETDSSKKQSANWVAEINGTPVAREEFVLYLRDQKAAAIHEYSELGLDPADESFWTDDSQQITPLQWAKERALEALKADKILQQQGAEQKLLESADYDSLMQLMEEENQRRADEKQEGGSAYGLQAFGEWTWLCYLSGQLEQQLLALAENTADPHDAELQELYDKQDSLFEEGRVYSLTLISSQGDVQNIELSERETGKEATEEQDLLARLQECKSGDVLENVSWQSEPVTVVVGQIRDGKRASFEEAREDLRILWARDDFARSLEKLQENASVRINDPLLSQIAMP